MTEPAGLQGQELAVPARTVDEGGIYETFKVIVQALLIAVVVRTLLFQPFSIPSGSLIPTLLIGDYLFVSKYSYGYSRHSLPFSPDVFSGRILGSPPRQGDVAVFKLPRDGQTDYIKRVIGLPGDTIQMKQGRLYINDVICPREETAKFRTPDVAGKDAEVATYIETLPNGVKHIIIERDGDRGFLDNTDAFKVPPGTYFMMGDNRDNSTDSRVPPEQQGVGFVPVENFVGRAEVVFFSLEEGQAAWEFWKWPASVRWSRMFQPVR